MAEGDGFNATKKKRINQGSHLDPQKKKTKGPTAEKRVVAKEKVDGPVAWQRIRTQKGEKEVLLRGKKERKAGDSKRKQANRSSSAGTAAAGSRRPPRGKKGGE